MSHPLIIYSAAFITGYAWMDVNSAHFIDKVKRISGMLSGKHKKILRKNFPFYSKLSPVLLKHFEQKLEYYFYKKIFVNPSGQPADDKKKLLISAYAAQLTFGLRDFYFLNLKKIVVYEDEFYSKQLNKMVSWEISKDGMISLCWKIFYKELKSTGLSSPLGLMVMANALKFEKYSVITEQIYMKNASSYFLNSKVVNRSENRLIFDEKDMKNSMDFFIACIIHYFSTPLELKNRYPELFKKIDYTMFKKVS